MGFIELVLIALGLAMDAFAVSVCKGFSVQRCHIRHMLICGLYFGIFQALMPLVGYLLGTRFESAVQSAAPCMAFFLLFCVGINMIIHAGDDEEQDADFSFRSMIPLAIATSIDALAIGVSFAFLHVSIGFAILVIGLITFVCCMAGVKLGSLFGNRYRIYAEQFGGIVLIMMAFKALWPFLVRLLSNNL